MSGDDPGGRDLDRPRMVEALASLKEGLSESDDPLYDGWKRRKAPGDAANNAAAAAHPNGPATHGGEHLPARGDRPVVTDPPDAQNRRLDSDTPEHLVSDARGRLDSDDPLAAPAALASPEAVALVDWPGEQRAAVARLSSETKDTVPVRVIRYTVFPKWALIVAASLSVFAGSVVALRSTYQGDPPSTVLAPRSSAHASAALPAEPTALQRPSLFAEHGPAPVPAPPHPPEPDEHDPLPAPASPAGSAKASKAKGADHKPKIPDPTFFRDPGF